MTNQEQFEVEVAEAYRRLAHDFRQMGRAPDGSPCFPGDDELVRALVRQAASRCGAAVSAAVKRAKRRHLLAGLTITSTTGVDVTPAVAQGTARRLLGRGLDSRETARLFATQGRTAATKSKVGADDLAGLEGDLAAGLALLLEELNEVKHRAAAHWFLSRERAEIMGDWSRQRRAQLINQFVV